MDTNFVLFISAAIFSIGAAGFLIRKNPLVMFMSVELMLNSVNVLLVGYSKALASLDGQIFALIIMTVAAAEVVVGLAIILTIFRRFELVGQPPAAHWRGPDWLRIRRWSFSGDAGGSRRHASAESRPKGW